MDVFAYMPMADQGRQFQRMTFDELLAADAHARRLGASLAAALSADEIIEIEGTRTPVIRVMRAWWPPCEVPGAIWRGIRKCPLHVVLQGVGPVPGKPAAEIEVGDRLSWNHAPSVSVVKGIVRRSEHYVWIIELYDDGQEFERRLKLSRIVAAETPGGNPDRRMIRSLHCGPVSA